MASLREVGIAVAAFLVEYVVVFVVSENLVEVEVASDTVDLAAGVTAAVIVAVAFDGVVFDYDYIACVAVDVVDVVLAGYVVFLSLLQLIMLVSLLLLMLMHDVYAIIFELMIWRVLFI